MCRNGCMYILTFICFCKTIVKVNKLYRKLSILPRVYLMVQDLLTSIKRERLGSVPTNVLRHISFLSNTFKPQRSTSEQISMILMLKCSSICNSVRLHWRLGLHNGCTKQFTHKLFFWKWGHSEIQFF